MQNKKLEMHLNTPEVIWLVNEPQYLFPTHWFTWHPSLLFCIRYSLSGAITETWSKERSIPLNCWHTEWRCHYAALWCKPKYPFLMCSLQRNDGTHNSAT